MHLRGGAVERVEQQGLLGRVLREDQLAGRHASLLKHKPGEEEPNFAPPKGIVHVPKTAALDPQATVDELMTMADELLAAGAQRGERATIREIVQRAGIGAGQGLGGRVPDGDAAVRDAGRAARPRPSRSRCSR